MNKRYKIRFEIFTLAAYRGLLISRNSTLLLFVIASFINMYLGYSGSPIYILMVLLFLPFILIQTQKNKERSHSLFVLSSIAKQYHYDKSVSVANQITYVIMILLSSLWYINFQSISHSYDWFRYAPVIILTLSLSIRILSTLYYIRRIHHILKN